jgi:hypothetical protein
MSMSYIFVVSEMWKLAFMFRDWEGCERRKEMSGNFGVWSGMWSRSGEGRGYVCELLLWLG